MTRKPYYTIEAWVPLVSEWQPVFSGHLARAGAEGRLRMEADGRRTRLVNAKGKVVLYAGKVPAEDRVA